MTPFNENTSVVPGSERPASLLEVTGLAVENLSKHAILSDVNFDIRKGEIFGLLGESSAGKTTLAKAILGALSGTLKIRAGRILFEGKELSLYSPKKMEILWGKEMSYLPQNAGASLNPVFRLKTQIGEVARTKSPRKDEQEEMVSRALRQVYLPDDRKFLRQYPFQLSGGQQQRFLIAELLVANPKLLIADEPTSAVDVSIQQEIITLLKDIRRKCGMSILFITHDLAVLRQIADRSGILFDGKIVEIQKTEELISEPRHDYTRELVELSKRLSL
ncbi:oligopeptide transport ATP-binding protein OppD [bacterium BMS3Abin05]|nr:oligopeptide transport ATP-binding protein OppD [bacterium BMS3Abin05]GBE26279.1 oligopeptide transport ATP-binding protein OppD [bacterium BMS3Bbin03]